MVVSHVCIRGKLLVLWSLCNSWMTLSLCIFRNTLTPDSECFCNRRCPLTFSILSLHGLVKQTSNSVHKIPNPPLRFFFHDKRKIESVFPGEQGEEIAHRKQTTSETGLICTGLALSGDVCHHRNMADHFLWNFLQIQTGLKSPSTIIIKLLHVPRWWLCCANRAFLSLFCTQTPQTHTNKWVEIKTNVRLPIFYWNI